MKREINNRYEDLGTLIISNKPNIESLKDRFGIYRPQIYKSCLDVVNNILSDDSQHYKIEKFNYTFLASNGYLCRTISKGTRARLLCFISRNYYQDAEKKRYPMGYAELADVIIGVKW